MKPPPFDYVAPESLEEVIAFLGEHGGSLAHGDPAAEPPTMMLLLDARLTARGPAGARTIQARDFFADALETALADDEFLVGIEIPPPPKGIGWDFEEFSHRAGDFALAGAAAMVGRNRDHGTADHAGASVPADPRGEEEGDGMYLGIEDGTSVVTGAAIR